MLQRTHDTLDVPEVVRYPVGPSCRVSKGDVANMDLFGSDSDLFGLGTSSEITSF